MPRVRAARREALSWRRITSTICVPIDSTGFSEVIGSCWISEICLPRIGRISAGDAARRSRPSNRMRPPSTRAFGGRRRMTAKAVTDLPQPDSPTSARVSPASTAKLTSRAATWPGKATVSSSTASRLMAQTGD
jgi:hypothetical protein